MLVSCSRLEQTCLQMAWNIFSLECYSEQQKHSHLNFVNAEWLVSHGQDWRPFHPILLQEGNKQINVWRVWRNGALGPVLKLECVKGWDSGQGSYLTILIIWAQEISSQNSKIISPVDCPVNYDAKNHLLAVSANKSSSQVLCARVGLPATILVSGFKFVERCSMSTFSHCSITQGVSKMGWYLPVDIGEVNTFEDGADLVFQLLSPHSRLEDGEADMDKLEEGRHHVRWEDLYKWAFLICIQS